MDTKRIPEVACGDPFFAGGLRKGQDHPHACLNGYVYLGYVVEEDGKEVERVEALPCRRCAEEAR